jgi:DNA-binding response OmpR family regulator
LRVYYTYMKLLVVEDDSTILTALKKGLEQESYIVDTASDGVTGYDLASTESYDLLILDRMLPLISGDEIVTKLRTSKTAVPILMLTAKGEIEDRVEGLDMGSDDYLTKPFAFDELLARIRALTRRPPTQQQNILSLRDITVNTHTYEVKRHNTLIKLSKKEYALLTYLLRNTGRTLSKEQIIGNVWSFNDDILPNTVEVYIRYLRNKIDLPFSDKQPLIHTVRGFGYKIE